MDLNKYSVFLWGFFSLKAFLSFFLSSCLAGWEEGAAWSEGALCEVLEGLADPHAGPVEGPSQGDENQEQQHGPRGVDPLVGLSLHPRSSLKRERERERGNTTGGSLQKIRMRLEFSLKAF